MPTPRQYELVYIVSPTVTDEAVAELHAQVEASVGKFKGSIEKTENWGRRKLAYEINHCKEGIYVLELLSGSGEMVAELERRMGVAEEVLRHLVVRVDEELHVAERTAARRAKERERRGGSRGLPSGTVDVPPSVDPAVTPGGNQESKEGIEGVHG